MRFLIRSELNLFLEHEYIYTLVDFLIFFSTVKAGRLNPLPTFERKDFLFPIEPSLETIALCQNEPDMHEDSKKDSISAKSYDKNPDYDRCINL